MGRGIELKSKFGERERGGKERLARNNSNLGIVGHEQNYVLKRLSQIQLCLILMTFCSRGSLLKHERGGS